MEKLPIDVRCPVCQAKPSEECTQPTNFGRKDVAWFHSARIFLAEEMSTAADEGWR